MDDIKETTVTEEKKEIVEQYKKLLFIVNPKAGQKKREDILVDVINIFNDYGYEVLIKFTRREKHATEIVKALGSQVDMIACMSIYNLFYPCAVCLYVYTTANRNERLILRKCRYHQQWYHERCYNDLFFHIIKRF